MFTDYKVVSDYSEKHLEMSVASLLKQGWQPTGGINVVPYPNNPDEYKKEGIDTMMYSQALVK